MRTLERRMRPIAVRSLGQEVRVEACGPVLTMVLGARSMDGRSVQADTLTLRTSSAGLAKAAAPRVVPLMAQLELDPESALRAAVQVRRGGICACASPRGREVVMYDVGIIDPAWPCRDKLRHTKTRRGAEDNYRTMSVADIARLPVNDDALIVLWVTAAHLFEAPFVLRAWGFTYAQQYVCWGKVQKHDRTKPKIAMGRIFRNSQEVGLVCTRGRPWRHLDYKGQSSLFLEPNDLHSKKPDALHAALERMFPMASYLELFARSTREGWTCLGNEIDGHDLRESLPRLAAKLRGQKESEAAE